MAEVFWALWGEEYAWKQLTGKRPMHAQNVGLKPVKIGMSSSLEEGLVPQRVS